MQFRSSTLAILILFLLSVFYVNTIHSTYMRDDEEIAFRGTSGDLASTFAFQAYQDVHPPIWFMSFWVWQELVGDSEFMGRVYSIFLSLLTLAVMYQIGRRWFQDERVGLCAVIAVGVNAYFVTYVLEIRPYGLILLVAALSMFLLVRWMDRPGWARAIPYGLTIALMLYLHYFMVFLVLAQIIYVLFVMRGRAIRYLIGSYVLAGVLWLPWIPIFVNQIQKLNAAEVEFGNARGVVGIGSTTEPTTLDAVWRLINAMSNGQVVLYALVLAYAIWVWRKQRFGLALSWAFGVPVLSLLTNLIFSVYTQRYISYLSIGVGLVMAAGIASVPRKLVIPVLVVFVAFSGWGIPSQYPYDRTPHRLLFQQMTAASRPGDVIYLDQADLANNVVQWQMRHYLSAELLQNRTEKLDGAVESRRVWYVTADWFDEGVQANFRALEQTHPVQQVLGDCTRSWCYLAQLMETAPLQTPISFDDGIGYRGVDVDAVSPEEIRLRLWWLADSQPRTNYSISIQLLRTDDVLVAQQDGVIQHYGQTIDTSTMTVGQLYIDSRVLMPTQPLQPGTYQLALVIYDWQTGVRLQTDDGNDFMILQELIVQ
jgi:hypothetical protein